MFVDIAANTKQEILPIGDSIVSGLSRYWKVWSKYFEPLQALKLAIGGDRTQHILWRLQNGEIPKNLQTAVIQCGTNNIDKKDPEDIKTAILSIVHFILGKKPQAEVIITGLLPRDKKNISPAKKNTNCKQEAQKLASRKTDVKLMLNS